jgi:hypothetical protein
MGRPSNKGFMPNIAGIITCILVGIVLTLLLTKIMMLEMFSEKLLKHLLMVAHAIAAWMGSVVCVAVGKARI